MRSQGSFKIYILKCSIVAFSRREDGEAASTMQFKPDFENGALLTVVITLIMGKLWITMEINSV